jgi:hypothetical protein
MSMNIIPQQKLCEIIAQYQDVLYDDSRRCEALLRDHCGTYRKEISVLIKAHEAGIIKDFLKVKNQQHPYATLKAKWIDQLQTNWALTEESASWAVETWAIALGISSKPPLNEQMRSQWQFWFIAASAMVIILGVTAFVKYQHQQAIHKAMIAAAYKKLVCKEPAIDIALASKKPDYIFSRGTLNEAKYYGPLPPSLRWTGGSLNIQLSPLRWTEGILDDQPSIRIPSYQGDLEGRGTLIFKDGARYDGEFKNGKRNGCGTNTEANSSTYMGQFKNDQFNGIGLLSLSDGARYIGEFRNKRCQGQGTFVPPDGTPQQGLWQNNQLIGTNLRCGLN